MSGKGLALGIDLGGSKIYAVVTGPAHRVLASAKIPTDPSAHAEKTAAAMKSAAMEALGKLGLTPADVEFRGAAVPSSVDPATGDCLQAVNMGWKTASMREILQSVFGCSFVLGNDGNLGLLAEYTCGAAKGFDSAIGYFIGTGLGGGIILNGKLLTGKTGLGGELGHMVVRAGGRRCGCGHRGCAEAYCSKLAFVKAIKKEVFRRGGATLLDDERLNHDTRNIKSKYLARAYAEDDPSVRKIVDKGLRMLGIAAASACAALAPQCVILGGGFTEAMGKAVLPPFAVSFRRNLFEIDPSRIAIRLSALGDDAVAVGATILARGGVELL